MVKVLTSGSPSGARRSARCSVVSDQVAVPSCSRSGARRDLAQDALGFGRAVLERRAAAGARGQGGQPVGVEAGHQLGHRRRRRGGRRAGGGGEAGAVGHGQQRLGAGHAVGPFGPGAGDLLQGGRVRARSRDAGAPSGGGASAHSWRDHNHTTRPPSYPLRAKRLQPWQADPLVHEQVGRRVPDATMMYPRADAAGRQEVALEPARNATSCSVRTAWVGGSPSRSCRP